MPDKIEKVKVVKAEEKPAKDNKKDNKKDEVKKEPKQKKQKKKEDEWKVFLLINILIFLYWFHSSLIVAARWNSCELGFAISSGRLFLQSATNCSDLL